MTTEPGSGAPMGSSQPPVPSEPDPAGGESTSDLLQSMLSRAVEGQVGDQRELASAIGDIRTQLMRLSQELGEMRTSQPQDDASDAQINTVTVEMREAVRFLSDRLDGVTRMVAQRGEELADIRTALTAIDAHVRSQAETIGVLSAGLQALPSYGERVSVLQDNLQVLHRQLVGIEEALAGAGDDEKVTERLKAIEEALAGVGDDEKVTERLKAIEEALAGVGDDEKVTERLKAIESSIAPLGNRLDEVSDLGTAQSALLSQLQSSTSQVHTAISGIHGRIDPLAEDITAIGGHVTSLVEGSADGAALDSRVNESVNQAVRDTEVRLIAHIDEAVLALAETLLKRRVTTSASQITGTPIVEPPAADDVQEPAESEPADDEAEAHDVDVDAEEADREAEDAEPVAVQTDADAAVAEPEEGDGEEWWERDLPTVAAAVEAATVPADSAGVSVDDEAVDHEAVDDEVGPDHWATPAVDLDDAEDGDEADDDDADDDDPEAVGTEQWPEAALDDEPSGPPVEADDAETESAEPVDATDAVRLPQFPAPPLPPVPTPEPWSPQTPPARNPADPTVTLDEGKKKRRWGRGKK